MIFQHCTQNWRVYSVQSIWLINNIDAKHYYTLPLVWNGLAHSLFCLHLSTVLHAGEHARNMKGRFLIPNASWLIERITRSPQPYIGCPQLSQEWGEWLWSISVTCTGSRGSSTWATHVLTTVLLKSTSSYEPQENKSISRLCTCILSIVLNSHW